MNRDDEDDRNRVFACCISAPRIFREPGSVDPFSVDIEAVAGPSFPSISSVSLPVQGVLAYQTKSLFPEHLWWFGVTANKMRQPCWSVEKYALPSDEYTLLDMGRAV
ncbi:hypothetical protein U1Q18_000492 [Sarracenia purpurea var. burkii]